MAVRQKDYNPANGLALLKAALGEQDSNTTPGRVPSGIAQNAYFSSMPNTNEQEREARDMDALDAGASDRFQAGMDQNSDINLANSGAHAMGFENPRAQMEDAAMKKLKLVLLPAQAKAAEKDADDAAQRSFVASENDKNRQSRESVVTAQQQGQTARTATAQAGATQRTNAIHPPSPLDRLFGITPAPVTPPSATAGADQSLPEAEIPDGTEKTFPNGAIGVRKNGKWIAKK